jgi:hypothetical protein
VKYCKYSHLERACSRDLSRWLATAYISVRRLPRELVDTTGRVVHREFDLEVTYRKELPWLQDAERCVCVRACARAPHSTRLPYCSCEAPWVLPQSCPLLQCFHGAHAHPPHTR